MLLNLEDLRAVCLPGFERKDHFRALLQKSLSVDDIFGSRKSPPYIVIRSRQLVATSLSENRTPAHSKFITVGLTEIDLEYTACSADGGHRIYRWQPESLVATSLSFLYAFTSSRHSFRAEKTRLWLRALEVSLSIIIPLSMFTDIFLQVWLVGRVGISLSFGLQYLLTLSGGSSCRARLSIVWLADSTTKSNTSATVCHGRKWEGPKSIKVCLERNDAPRLVTNLLSYQVEIPESSCHTSERRLRTRSKGTHQRSGDVDVISSIRGHVFLKDNERYDTLSSLSFFPFALLPCYRIKIGRQLFSVSCGPHSIRRRKTGFLLDCFFPLSLIAIVLSMKMQLVFEIRSIQESSQSTDG